MWKSIIAICVGASAGALLRWLLGSRLNGYFPAIPLGTLTGNFVGAYVNRPSRRHDHRRMGAFLSAAAPFFEGGSNMDGLFLRFYFQESQKCRNGVAWEWLLQ